MATTGPVTYDEVDKIEVANLDDASDDGYGTDTKSTSGSSTQSIHSSMLDYEYENGRRYQRGGLVPNDATEQDRLDMQHHLALLLLNGELCFTDFEGQDPHNVLDCGTGTGIWALDFGDNHPGSQVIGCDISPIQPSWVAPNVKFEIDDLNKEWTWKKESFDFIHSRYIGIGIKDYDYYAQQIYDALIPGGRVEFGEQEHDIHSDDDTKAGSFAEAYFTRFVRCIEKAGLSPPTDTLITGALVKAGFEDVRVHKIKQPWGPWAKKKDLRHAGHVTAGVAEGGLPAYGLALFTRYDDMQPEEVKTLCENVIKEVMGRKVHVYNHIMHITARKPAKEKKESQTEVTVEA
ncbi:S-adenosyl-L-methionine-dependent methyltransferase [Ascodesmis nigricans]|uniref:S-adenosyl-L-methionine-dependent methyltransferase n=1 Tax=Ascodesmis nigricans TaxID=341454 RepID=A0A4S2MW22_9PEZI|nr:S-adenosyl-L-methionine-dependent methyltransferase [Ascodesmis nigricans]